MYAGPGSVQGHSSSPKQACCGCHCSLGIVTKHRDHQRMRISSISRGFQVLPTKDFNEAAGLQEEMIRISILYVVCVCALCVCVGCTHAYARVHVCVLV